jgi:DNA-directed RNA polymerase subunit H
LAEEKEAKLDILKHELVPKHTILTKEEAEELRKKYKIELYQLPYIKSSDPVVIMIDAKPGDVVKIIRKSPTAGEAVAYRYVLEG